jgi:nitroreductase
VVSREFKLPENLVPVNILAIGYADGEPASPDRHATERMLLNETVFFESMG